MVLLNKFDGNICFEKLCCYVTTFQNPLPSASHRRWTVLPESLVTFVNFLIKWRKYGLSVVTVVVGGEIVDWVVNSGLPVVDKSNWLLLLGLETLLNVAFT